MNEDKSRKFRLIHKQGKPHKVPFYKQLRVNFFKRHHKLPSEYLYIAAIVTCVAALSVSLSIIPISSLCV